MRQPEHPLPQSSDSETDSWITELEQYLMGAYFDWVNRHPNSFERNRRIIELSARPDEVVKRVDELMPGDYFTAIKALPRSEKTEDNFKLGRPRLINREIRYPAVDEWSQISNFYPDYLVLVSLANSLSRS